MRIGISRTSRFAAVLLVLALIAAACGDDADDTTTTAAAAAAGTETTAATTPVAAGEPIRVGELAYYTGEFAPYGPSLTADVTFPVEEVINLDPPLGRPFELYHEDIGTVGEGQAARTLVEQHDIDVLVSAAHEYRTYRDWLQEVIAEQNRPLMPTVHGGTIPQNLGGVGTEPIFRAQGLDEALGMSGVQYADTIGATSVVIFATQVEGFQLAADAAEKTAAALGIEVLDRLDVQAEQATYRTEAQRIAELEPDAVIVQAGSVESATLIKQADEAGLSLHWIGETGWIQPEFIGTLTTDPIATQQSIGFAAFSANTGTPAWEFYSDLWNNNPDYSQYGDANDQYHFSTYDLMIITALAIEEAGSADASDWAPAMFMVTDPPGMVCYTYAECLALIRAGEEIDYEGVTGPGTFTDGGVNAVTQTYTPFNEDGSVGTIVVLDPDEGLAIIEVIAVEAECDPDNVCTW
jgi:ABC-type branched-subunit amino acid transport system substrate-binding protein